MDRIYSTRRTDANHPNPIQQPSFNTPNHQYAQSRSGKAAIKRRRDHGASIPIATHVPVRHHQSRYWILNTDLDSITIGTVRKRPTIRTIGSIQKHAQYPDLAFAPTHTRVLVCVPDDPWLGAVFYLVTSRHQIKSSLVVRHNLQHCHRHWRYRNIDLSHFCGSFWSRNRPVCNGFSCNTMLANGEDAGLISLTSPSPSLPKLLFTVKPRKRCNSHVTCLSCRSTQHRSFLEQISKAGFESLFITGKLAWETCSSLVPAVPTQGFLTLTVHVTLIAQRLSRRQHCIVKG